MTDQEVIRAYNAATGSHVECIPEHECGLCIEQSDAFKGIVVLGLFANDRGCRPTGIFVGRRLLQDFASAAPLAFARAGWATADAEVRKKLAALWVTDVTRRMSDSYIVSELPAKDFALAPPGTSPFAPPHAEASPSGSIVVSAWWSRANGGMTKSTETTYTLAQLEIGIDGTIVSEKSVSEFKAPIAP